MKQHRIYWTIVSVLMMGLLYGSLLSLEKLEAREEPEPITLLTKLYCGIGIFLYSLAFYLAGKEYWGLRQTGGGTEAKLSESSDRPRMAESAR